MNIIRFDLLIEGQGDALHSALHVRCNGLDYTADRTHDRGEVAITGWDGDIEKLRAIIAADMRAQVMRKIERDVFADWKAA